MKDSWGRINNRCQAIRGFNLSQMAFFLSLVTSKSDNYPKTLDQ